MVIQIRNYDDDLMACRNLWRELTEHHRRIYDDQSIGGGEPSKLFDEHLEKVGAGRIWVAEKDDKIVGMIGLQETEEGTEIEPVVVKKEYRGKGIGKELLQFAISKAEDLGVRYLMVRPVMRNREAIRMFHQQGFINIGRVELFMDLKGEEWEKGPSLFGLQFRY